MSQFLSNISILVEAPVFNLALLIDGLLIGSVFALAAYGLALVWGVMNVKNLAQGDFVMIGGYIAWWMSQHGIHPLFGVPVAIVLLWLFGGGLYGTAVHRVALATVTIGRRLTMRALPDWLERFVQSILGVVIFLLILAVVSFAAVVLSLLAIGGVPFGVQARDYTLILTLLLALILLGGIYGLVIRRVIEQDLFTSLLATFGVAIVIEQVLNLMFGSDTQSAETGFSSLFLFGGLVTLPIAKLIAFGLAAGLAGSVILFMKKSRMGQAIRATAQDARAARVMGINTDKVYAFTFSLNAAICGAAGALIVMIWVIQPFFGITYSIRSFVIVTAAGFGNLPGVIAAGLGMGVFEQFGGFILGAEFQQAIVVGLLVAVLIIRQIQQARHRQVVQ